MRIAGGLSSATVSQGSGENQRIQLATVGGKGQWLMTMSTDRGIGLYDVANGKYVWEIQPK